LSPAAESHVKTYRVHDAKDSPAELQLPVTCYFRLNSIYNEKKKRLTGRPFRALDFVAIRVKIITTGVASFGEWLGGGRLCRGTDPKHFAL
jgi:hypothetical protein